MRFVPFSLLLVALAAGCASPLLAQDEVVGRIGTIEITAAKIREQLATLSEAELQTMQRDPAGLNQYVRALLIQEVVLREAVAKEWDKSPQVEERMKALKEGVVSSTYLQSIGEPPAGFPSEVELKTTYEANKELLLQPMSWRLAQIYLADPVSGQDKSPSTAVAPKLEAVKKALGQSNADFAAIAKQHSEESASAALGGEIGWMFENQIHPDVRAVLPSLKPAGPASAPVRMDDGWHFIKILEQRDPYTPTLEQIRDLLIRQMRAERGRIDTERFLSRLLQENPVAINEMAVAKIIPPAVK